MRDAMVGRRAGHRRRLRLRLPPDPRAEDRLDLRLPGLRPEERRGGERGQGRRPRPSAPGRSIRTPCSSPWNTPRPTCRS